MARPKRIFVDTNLFLRSVLGDNVAQAKVASELFESAVLNKAELKTTVVVFFEVAWVLRSYYRVLKEDLKKVLTDLLDLKVTFVGEKVLRKSVREIERFGYDLEDAFNFYSAKEMEVEEFATFDEKLKEVWKKSV